jgi:hypothetical protein
MFKGEQIKSKNVVPGLGERWDRPVEQQVVNDATSMRARLRARHGVLLREPKNGVGI